MNDNRSIRLKGNDLRSMQDSIRADSRRIISQIQGKRGLTDSGPISSYATTVCNRWMHCYVALPVILHPEGLSSTRSEPFALPQKTVSTTIAAFSYFEVSPSLQTDLLRGAAFAESKLLFNIVVKRYSVTCKRRQSYCLLHHEYHDFTKKVLLVTGRGLPPVVNKHGLLYQLMSLHPL
jgi:hypothetical protein